MVTGSTGERNPRALARGGLRRREWEVQFKSSLSYYPCGPGHVASQLLIPSHEKLGGHTD